MDRILLLIIPKINILINSIMIERIEIKLEMGFNTITIYNDNSFTALLTN